MAALPPLSTIGILGGGQLGRMLALAAANLGFRVHIYAPEADSPAFDVTRFSTCAAYDDFAALEVFAKACDVITYEFENIPLATVEFLEGLKPVFPRAAALKVAQDRLQEKAFAQNFGLNVPPFAAVLCDDDFAPALADVTLPAVLKTARMGYDGKGQRKISTASDLATVFAELGSVACILEQFVNFEAEISIIAARGQNGDIQVYDLVENVHEHHILARSIVPSRYAEALTERARTYAQDLLNGLDYVGVLAMEFFVVRDENNTLTLYFNEMAPRVHNSGHWTMTATHTCQFEQHIRAIAGWPLGSTRRHAALEMHNILGDESGNWAQYAAERTTKLTLYGKTEAKAGRKMGHLTKVKIIDAPFTPR